ncbi:MAG: zinc ribbon domain-containing protein [Methanocorpusculum sp.]|nr:zinc ribbon domain-containing protein [Methanocorpusculum sp.]
MYCPYCGVELPEDSHFCIACGKDLSGLNESSETVAEKPVIQEQATTVKQPETSYSTSPEIGDFSFDTTKKGKSIAAFVLGILGMIFSLTGWCLLGIIGTIIGIVAVVKRHGIKWMAILGLILSALSVFIGICVAIAKFL